MPRRFENNWRCCGRVKMAVGEMTQSSTAIRAFTNSFVNHRQILFFFFSRQFRDSLWRIYPLGGISRGCRWFIYLLIVIHLVTFIARVITWNVFWFIPAVEKRNEIRRVTKAIYAWNIQRQWIKLNKWWIETHQHSYSRGTRVVRLDSSCRHEETFLCLWQGRL